jgi:hypothetical protein
MAKEKKPSIYSDRGTIGSSEELDEYGVWVKSEPQDLSSEEDETPEFSGGDDLDFAIPDMEDLPDLVPLDEKSSDDFSIAELPTDDFAIPDIESGGETENIPSITDEIGNDVDLGDLSEDAGIVSLDIPDLEVPDDSGVLESPVELTGLDESGLEDNFDLPEIVEEDQVIPSPDTGLPGTESGDDLAGISTETSMDDLIENFDAGTEELSGESMGLDSAAVDDAFAASTAPTQTGIRQEAGFAAVTGSPMDSGLKAPSSSADLSTQLLMKIAEELSSIRAELSSLKKEFSVIRAGAPAAETEESGFFDKEDDEKISLTGDELNNILNTADFTEETGTDITLGLSDDDAGAPDLPTGMDAEAVTEVDTEAVTEVDTEAVTDSTSPADLPEDVVVPEEAVSGFSVEGIEGIEEKQDKPITHDLTAEDTNYLAKEAAIDAVGSINLEEAVIDEPDLSHAQDSPVEEPLPDDLSVNLDIEEPVPEDTASEEPDATDITSEGLGDLDITAEGLGDLDISSEGLGDLGITADEPGGADIASEEPVNLDIAADDLGDLGIASGEPGGADVTSEELGDLDISSEGLGDLGIASGEPGGTDVASEGLGDLDISSEGLGDLGISSGEPGGADIASEELGDLDISTDELGDLDINTDELGDLGIAAEEPAAEEPVTEALGAEAPVTEAPVTEAPVAEEGGTGELSILELGAGDFDLAEPVSGEPGAEPTEEEPASEEDFGILAADEQPEEDFGILVVDEPSGEIPEAAEEHNEEVAVQEAVSADTEEISAIPGHLKQELKTVLSYMDQLLEALPDEKIEEFARSEYYDTYKKLFRDLGIV